MCQQGAQDVRIRPVVQALRQSECRAVPRCIGSPKIALGAHIEQPPREPVAVQGHTVLLKHHEALGPDRDERSESSNLPLRVDPMNQDVRQPSGVVAQRVLNGSRGTEPNDLAAERPQGARARRLTDSNQFKELSSGKRRFCELETDGIGVT